MSLDKEAATIAMEYLAEDPASASPEGDPATLPALKTAQDLLDWVQLDPDLGPQQRSNEASAIRALGRVINTPLSTIPLDQEYLLNVCYKNIRADKTLNQAPTTNIITLLNPSLEARRHHQGRVPPLRQDQLCLDQVARIADRSKR